MKLKETSELSYYNRHENYMKSLDFWNHAAKFVICLLFALWRT